MPPRTASDAASQLAHRRDEFDADDGVYRRPLAARRWQRATSSNRPSDNCTMACWSSRVRPSSDGVGYHLHDSGSGLDDFVGQGSSRLPGAPSISHSNHSPHSGQKYAGRGGSG